MAAVSFGGNEKQPSIMDLIMVRFHLAKVINIPIIYEWSTFKGKKRHNKLVSVLKVLSKINC